MKSLFAYLKGHSKTAITIVIFFFIFAVVSMLYDLPAEPIIYSFVLCVSVLLLMTIVDYVRYRSKKELLTQLQKTITVDIDQLLAPENEIEEGYTQLINVMHQQLARINSDQNLKLAEMTDYYTLWAHQIKTPISAMRLILQSEDSSNNVELSANLFKIEQYVEMALVFLRSDSMSSDLLIKPYSIDSILKQIFRKYAQEFIRRKISLDYDEVGETVITDEKWLAFVIEQVLSNALKYTQKGKISIYMHPNHPCTLVIEDTGIGIQAEDIPRVFERGFTGYNGRTDKKSTGIGLFMCSRIMSKLNHHISIESEVGVGTRVLLDLYRPALEVE